MASVLISAGLCHRIATLRTAYGLVSALVLVGSTLPDARGNGVVLADSVTEFSLTQGQDAWFYGIYDQTTHGPVYLPDQFRPFDVADGSANTWKASETLVPSPDPDGRDNRVFLNLNAEGGHPTGIDIDGQNRIVWAVRRYVSEIAGTLAVRFDARKINIANPNGGGITARIFVDGTPLLSQYIANMDGLGVQGTLNVPVSVGSRIDFAIDPLGVVSPRDGVYSPRADGSHFSAVITEVPESTGMTLSGLGWVSGWHVARRRQRQRRSAGQGES